MATDWTAEQYQAYLDLKEDGFSVTVRRPGSPGTWNDTTGEYDGATDPTDYTAYGIKTRRDLTDATGTIVQRDVSVLLISAYGLPADFSTSDEVLVGSEVQSVTRISPVDPGNVPLTYEVYLG